MSFIYTWFNEERKEQIRNGYITYKKVGFIFIFKKRFLLNEFKKQDVKGFEEARIIVNYPSVRLIHWSLYIYTLIIQ